MSVSVSVCVWCECVLCPILHIDDQVDLLALLHKRFQKAYNGVSVSVSMCVCVCVACVYVWCVCE